MANQREWKILVRYLPESLSHQQGDEKLAQLSLAMTQAVDLVWTAVGKTDYAAGQLALLNLQYEDFNTFVLTKTTPDSVQSFPKAVSLLPKLWVWIKTQTFDTSAD